MLTVPRHVRNPRALARAALTVAVVSTPTLGGEFAAQTSRTARHVPVYVVDFRLVGTLPPELSQLHMTASEMMRLGLLEVPRVTPVRTKEAPACGSTGPAAQKAGTEGNRAGEFFVVRGWISAREDEVLLDYALEQCGGDSLASIAHETEPLSRASLLEGLSRAARYISSLTRRQLPKTTVAILPFTPANSRDTNEVAAAALVEQQLLNAIWASPDFEAVEAANARYRLSGRVALRPPAASGRPRSVEIQIRVLANTAAPESLPTVTAPISSLRSAAASTVRQTLAWLTETQHSDSPGPPGDADAATLRLRAMDLLCNPARDGCLPDTVRAIALLTTASARSDADRAVFASLGRLTVTRDPLLALQALGRARDLMEEERIAGREIAIGERVEVLNALGDSRFRLGDFAAAAAEYDKSLDVRRDQPGVQVQYARSLRLAEQRTAALRALAEALRLRPRDESLYGETLQLIRALTSADVMPSAPLDSLVSIIRGGPAMLRRQVADSLLETGGQLFRARAGAAPVRAVLEQVPALGIDDPLILVNTYGYLAAAHLGTLVAEPGPNECIARSISDFDRTRVEAYLVRAEAAVRDSHAPHIREWILRLRGLQLMREGRYPQAQELIERGLALNASTHARFAAAQIAFLRARAAEDSAFKRCGQTGSSLPAARAGYERAIGLLRPLVEERYTWADWYLRETLHSLARDRETHEILSAVLRRQPDDVSALETQKFVCNEYLLDFTCSFGVVKTLESLGRLAPEDAGGVLDAVEIALLVQENRRAIAWQRWLTPETLDPLNRLVDAYQRFWISTETASPDSAGRAFQHWLGALQTLRSAPVQMSWSFKGVRHTIGAPGRFTRQCAEFLLQMIDAMEGPDRPAPTWTAQCGSR